MRRALVLTLVLALVSTILPQLFTALSQPITAEDDVTILTAVMYLEPGDAVAPHFKEVRFDGVNDYGVISISVYGWGAISVINGIHMKYPKSTSGYSSFSAIGDPNTDYPALYFRTGSGTSYSSVTLYLTARNVTDNTRKTFSNAVSDYRNLTVQVATVFNETTGRWEVYGNTFLKYSVTTSTSNLLTILNYNPDTATNPVAYRRFVLGASALINEYMSITYDYLLIYNRAISWTEINSTYYHVVYGNGLQAFVDPTWNNSTHLLDISGNERHVTLYNDPAIVEDIDKWLWLIKGLHSDGLVHFRFFPAEWNIYLLNATSGELVTSFKTLSSDDAINLQAGTYIVIASSAPLALGETITNIVTATITETATSTTTTTAIVDDPVVWHDPSVVQNHVLYGATLISTSIAYTILSAFMVLHPPRRLRGMVRIIAILTGWLILLTMNLAYVSSYSTIVYGIGFDINTGEHIYHVAENPTTIPILAVTIATSIIILSIVLYAILSEEGRRVVGYMVR
ncbi:hypothetical protein [Thermosphaera sp.]